MGRPGIALAYLVGTLVLALGAVVAGALLGRALTRTRKVWAVTLVLVLIGGAVGAPLRYVMDLAVQRWHGGRFPWGTLVVNVCGSLLLGVLLGAAASGTSDVASTERPRSRRDGVLRGPDDVLDVQLRDGSAHRGRRHHGGLRQRAPEPGVWARGGRPRLGVGAGGALSLGRVSLSVAAEGLLEPPGRLVSTDLGIDEQGSVT